MENIKDFNAKVVVNSLAGRVLERNPNYEGPSTADIRSGETSPGTVSTL
ncbi:MAG: hypothetical protein ACLSG5_06605 [Oscillospiraceae bacterium]